MAPQHSPRLEYSYPKVLTPGYEHLGYLIRSGCCLAAWFRAVNLLELPQVRFRSVYALQHKRAYAWNHDSSTR